MQKEVVCWLSPTAAVNRSMLPEVGTGETQHPRHAADPPRASGWGTPHALTLFRGVKLIAWRLGHPTIGEYRRTRGIFGNAGSVWATALRPDPPLKRPCATLVRWWDRCQMTLTIWRQRILGRGPLTWVLGKPNIHVTRPTHLEHQGSVPQALTLLGGVRFIVWHLRRSFLEECRWGPRHFWSHRACLGYGPMLGSTLKKALCHTRSFGGTRDK